MLPTPRALLLDFGGVIADGRPPPGWETALVGAVNDVLTSAGLATVTPEAVLGPLDADDRRSDQAWRSGAPTQPDHETFWGDVVAAEWPSPARQAVVRHAAALSRRLVMERHGRAWRLRPGMADLLADVGRRRLPVAVVSNTLCGAPHRDFLAGAGLAGHFTAQFYSDEEGVRKPNPEFALRATAALGVKPEECWFVGDTVSRDVLVARRAGMGASILMRSSRVERPPHPDGVAPDAVVDDPVRLHQLLRDSLTP